MTRCSVCSLPPDRRTAVDQAIRERVPLGKISELCGISKSSLSRHSAHLGEAADAAGQFPCPPASQQAPAEPERAVTAPPPAPAQQGALAAPLQASVGPTRDELIKRIEFLWGEACEGLADAKKPLTIAKPNGETIQVDPDVRTRIGFLREGREITRLAGEASGHLRGDGGGFGVAIVINCPAVSVPAGYDLDAVTVEIGPGQGGR